ncbi:MAG: 23S rRNA (adenine(2503)-C(2))-methyltransferase RlmN, partial [Gemmatimonadetes bacterium]|nr:23S rRNA (adenine(2503)-C(2))-methyltransferase RlmN [Gemmatimonadota bacterium]
RGEPAYRLNQVLPRLWQRPVASWADALELPAPLRRALEVEWPFGRLGMVVRQDSRDGTVKFLWRLPDGEAIESVLIPEGARRTLCISSQAGCPLRCAFCATGTMGLHRNLAAWEIAAQVREMLLLPEPVKPTNVVFMGMGEPLVNWKAVGPALTILNDPGGFGIGARHITVSTVGILPGLAELAKRPEQFRLAISLHAPTSETRLTIMPIEKRYPLPRVLEAAKAFKRRITFEYVLIGDVNDRDEDLAALAAIAKASGALVNLLPLHPGGAPGLKPSPKRRMHWFASALRRRGVEAVLRKSRGLDIDAACGQLRIASGGGQAGEVAAQTHGEVDEPAGVRSGAHHAGV